jgi:hypothetical protein
MGWTTKGSEFEFRWGKKLLPLHVVQNDSGVHPTSYPMGIETLSSRLKQQVREADHSPPASAVVKKMWIYTSTTPYAFMV